MTFTKQVNILYNKFIIKRYNIFRFYFFIKIFDDKSIRDIKSKYNKVFKSNY